MANDVPNPWKQNARDAAARIEEELRGVAAYINDVVVPEVRLHGSQANDFEVLRCLEVAARKLNESDEAGAQKALDASRLTRLTPDGVALMRAVVGSLGIPRAVQRYLLKVIENMDLRPPRAAA